MTSVLVTDAAAVAAVANTSNPITVSPDPAAVGGWQVLCGEVVVGKDFGSHAEAEVAAEEYGVWRKAVAAMPKPAPAPVPTPAKAA